MRNNLFIIAKSGWKYIAYAVAASIVFSILDMDLLAFFAFLAAISFVYLFRNPERVMPFYQQKSLVSPCDGVVTAIEQLEGSDYAYRLDIESSYFDVGVLRVPMHAKVEEIVIVKGARVAKNSKLFPLLNEYAAITFCDDSDNSVKVLHRLKQSLAPLNLNVGQELKGSETLIGYFS